MAEQRKLATIMSVDVAGYSRAAEADDGAAAASVTRLRAALEAAIAPNNGRIFNTAGDGFMIEFPASQPRKRCWRTQPRTVCRACASACTWATSSSRRTATSSGTASMAPHACKRWPSPAPWC
jgi:class 3 adenylate cyclase